RRSCSPSCERSQTLCTDPPLARRLAGEPRTVAFHPSPNTPSKASLPPLSGKEVLPMCPVQCVTYVSGRSISLINRHILGSCYFCATILTACQGSETALSIYIRQRVDGKGWRYVRVEEGRGKRTGELHPHFYARPTVNGKQIWHPFALS